MSGLCEDANVFGVPLFKDYILPPLIGVTSSLPFYFDEGIYRRLSLLRMRDNSNFPLFFELPVFYTLISSSRFRRFLFLCWLLSYFSSISCYLRTWWHELMRFLLSLYGILNLSFICITYPSFIISLSWLISRVREACSDRSNSRACLSFILEFSVSWRSYCYEICYKMVTNSPNVYIGSCQIMVPGMTFPWLSIDCKGYLEPRIVSK